MSFFDKAIKSAAQNDTESMHTSFPAMVVSYNQEAHTAVIQPLWKYNNGSTYPQIQGVPVAKVRINQKHLTVEPVTQLGGAGDDAHTHGITIVESVEEIIYPILLKSGDIVQCVVFERSIDSVSSKQVHEPQSKRMFDLTDCMITSIIYTA